MTKTLILLGAVAVTLVATLTVPQDNRVVADKDHLQKQKTIIKLLHRVHQPNHYDDLAQIGNSYDIEQNIDKYKDADVVKDFLRHYKIGFLQRGKIFSILYEKHRHEMIHLFEILLFANDYDTFIKTACWARDRINEGQFVYALTTAVYHHPDTKDVVVPPLYEVLPHHFFNTHIIKQAYEAKMREENALIHSNHTRCSTNVNQKVSYFTEDIDLNHFYSMWHKEHPFWYKSVYGKDHDRDGELFYYVHQQLLARYDLERLANDLPRIEPFKFKKPIKYGYSPRLTYWQGMDFPVRPEDMYVKDLDSLKVLDVKEFERRVKQIIDFGYFYSQVDKQQVSIDNDKGIDALGRIIEGKEGSETYSTRTYGSIKNMGHSLLGHVVDPLHKYGVPPSVLEHYETAVRDPVFYSLHKHIDNIFQRHKDLLHHYSQEELLIPGVKIVNVETDRLITYFEDFDVDLTNVVEDKVTVTNDEHPHDVSIKARVKRINHRPFTLKVEVDSEKTVSALLRVFIGPKYDYYGQEIPLDERRHMMIELDKFPVQVNSGKNVIERHSRDFNLIIPDHYPGKTVLQMVDSAIEEKDTYYVQKRHHCGFPEHLLLPKGKVGGMPVSVFVMLSEYEGSEGRDVAFQESLILCGAEDHPYPDEKPMGFPFDRHIHEHDFYVPNMYFKDVQIFHKKDISDMNKPLP